MGAAARPQDVARLRDWQAAGELRSAVVLDAVLSEKADFGLDFIEQAVAQERRAQGATLGQRLSCGYGDFSLEHQDFFYNTLELSRHGIRLNERHIFEPEKTVTGLLPIFAGDASHA
jgi:cobalamin-dependent methionine synthase I